MDDARRARRARTCRPLRPPSSPLSPEELLLQQQIVTKKMPMLEPTKTTRVSHAHQREGAITTTTTKAIVKNAPPSLATPLLPGPPERRPVGAPAGKGGKGSLGARGGRHTAAPPLSTVPLPVATMKAGNGETSSQTNGSSRNSSRSEGGYRQRRRQHQPRIRLRLTRKVQRGRGRGTKKRRALLPLRAHMRLVFVTEHARRAVHTGVRARAAAGLRRRSTPTMRQ